MPDIINNAKATVLLYKMQIAWFVLFTLSSLGAAVMTALTGTQWNQTDQQTHFMIEVGIFVSWANTMMALFNKSMNRLKDGDPPFVDGASVTTQTTATLKTEKTVSTTPP